MRSSGSPITLSEISASIRSMLMSLEESLERCDISARVLVRSTNESRPSSDDIKRMERCFIDASVVALFEADSIDGT